MDVKLVEYIKEVSGEKITIYKYNDEGEMIEFAEIYLDSDDSEVVHVVFYGYDAWFECDTSARLQNFGVSSFEELKNLPEEELGEMIWE